MQEVTAYKLFRVTKDPFFPLRSLFIDKNERILERQWLQAKMVPTPGFKPRFGWHACSKKSAPHLSKKGRVWARVSLIDVTEHHRPRSQGGLWYTAAWMKIEEVLW